MAAAACRSRGAGRHARLTAVRGQRRDRCRGSAKIPGDGRAGSDHPPRAVRPPRGRLVPRDMAGAAPPGERGPGTAIYYLLAEEERSHWHRIDAAEVWHFYAGDPCDWSSRAARSPLTEWCWERPSLRGSTPSTSCPLAPGNQRAPLVAGRSSDARCHPPSTLPDSNWLRPTGDPDNERRPDVGAPAR